MYNSKGTDLSDTYVGIGQGFTSGRLDRLVVGTLVPEWQKYGYKSRSRRKVSHLQTHIPAILYFVSNCAHV